MRTPFFIKMSIVLLFFPIITLIQPHCFLDLPSPKPLLSISLCLRHSYSRDIHLSNLSPPSWLCSYLTFSMRTDLKVLSLHASQSICYLSYSVLLFYKTSLSNGLNNLLIHYIYNLLSVFPL